MKFKKLFRGSEDPTMGCRLLQRIFLTNVWNSHTEGDGGLSSCKQLWKWVQSVWLKAKRTTHSTGLQLIKFNSTEMLCCAQSLLSCLTLSDDMDRSPAGSPIHGILQARMLEWIAMPSSRGSSRPRDQTCVSSVSRTGRQVLYGYHYLGSPKQSWPLGLWD